MEIDYSLFVNFFVALGTILLAIFAFRNIQITQKQLQSFQDQTKVFISQNQPILRVISFSFRKNELLLQIKNLGTQPAYDIGVSCICLNVKKIQDIMHVQWLFDFKWPNVKKEDIMDYFEIENKQLITVKDRNEPSIQINLKPEYTINFLKREDNGESNLSNTEGMVLFKSEPYFIFDNDLENRREISLKGYPKSLENYMYQRYTFNELKDVFKQNGIRYAYIPFVLYCKDSLENSVFQSEIINCIVDLDTDQTIGDAISKPRKLTSYLMSPPRFVREVGCQPQWMYEHGKWKKHNIPDEVE